MLISCKGLYALLKNFYIKVIISNIIAEINFKNNRIFFTFLKFGNEFCTLGKVESDNLVVTQRNKGKQDLFIE